MINAKLFQQMFCPSRRRGSFKISQIIFHDLKMDPDWKVITQTLRVIVILILNEPSLMQGPKPLLTEFGICHSEFCIPKMPAVSTLFVICSNWLCRRVIWLFEASAFEMWPLEMLNSWSLSLWMVWQWTSLVTDSILSIKSAFHTLGSL